MIVYYMYDFLLIWPNVLVNPIKYLKFNQIGISAMVVSCSILLKETQIGASTGIISNSTRLELLHHGRGMW